ncbi:MAG TPA: PAS domain-containing sensor histidine kinase, partial [Cyclobacteriaceae bacterium]|nr:PAS domain-containing sensor histidine kinase [Cyclobacteriaceae bacterium]
IFGYDPGELTGLTMEVLVPREHKGHHANLRKGFNTHPEPRRMGFGRDLTALKKDGREFPVEISLSYTRVKGKLLVMAFISDISERKKSEEALKRSEEQLIVYAAELERKVQSRTEALHKTIRELEKEVVERKRAEEETRKALEKEREFNDLKTKFVSIASHEFRTPLSTILSSIALVEQYKQRNDLDKIDKHTARIRSSVEHLTAILNDFLSLGRLEEGKVEVINEIIPMESFFQDLIEEVKPSLKKDQHVVLDMKNETTAFTDVRILRNILFNLISNASKYSEEGKDIEIHVSADTKTLAIAIQDHGIGIPEEDHKHLFERFFRAGNVSNIQGTGLGLNIVKRYIDLLKGDITFESEYKKGSIFTVLIPLNA